MCISYKYNMKIGIDIGGSHIGIGVVNEEGDILEKKEKRIMKKDKENIKKTIEEYIIENVKEFQEKYDISDIGIAIPGKVTSDTVIKSVNLGIENYNIIKSLNEKIKLPIKIKNDAKCAAIAENEYGCLKKYNKNIFLTLGTGIGGAVIINNKLFETENVINCEFGHMVIEKNGIECTCGRNGCFEKYASMKSFKNELRQRLALDEKTRGQELFDMIKTNFKEKENYEVIEEVVDDFVTSISIGIVNLTNVFAPQSVGIGGSFVHFEEVFLERLKMKLQKENTFSGDEIKIEVASLGNDAGIIGATLI